MVNPRVVLYSEEWGVYLGNAMGFGFWSKLDPVGQTAAVTFLDEDEVRAHIATWDSGPPPAWRVVPVHRTYDGYALIEDCVAAGLPAWSVE